MLKNSSVKANRQLQMYLRRQLSPPSRSLSLPETTVFRSVLYSASPLRSKAFHCSQSTYRSSIYLVSKSQDIIDYLIRNLGSQINEQYK